MIRLPAGLFVALYFALAFQGEAFAEDQYFDSAGVRIRYIDEGAGEPVILLHGNPTWIESNWVETGVVEGLTESSRVIALDLRGFGRSDMPYDPSAYGSEMAEDVIRLMDHLSLEQAHVVGYSMGARITSWLIVNHSERLITASLIASTYYIESQDRRESFEAAAKRWESDSPYDRAALSREAGMTDEEMDTFIARRLEMNDARAIVAAYRGMTGLFIEEAELSQTDIPVLHVVGSLDLPRLEASRRLTEVVLPSTKFEMVEGATHSGPKGLYGRPELVEAITDFIGQH